MKFVTSRARAQFLVTRDSKPSEALPSWRESSRRPPNHHRSHRESPEHRRRPCNLTGEEISPCFDPSRRFLESSTIFLLDPATGEGFGWKPTLFLVDLVSKDP
ncbi:BnaC03g16780D [Brassica napus]|uniref:(rape) hypothetical protein n=1 Tax=Brassica napus TaxID=3708 RepID=A0A078GHB7_BRANA|nr:unnamed protein product [Brassica napus]CDY24013.1 BnaC03g16780D [Brassica napus]